MSQTKSKLLWVGDAGVASGFAKVTHKVLDNLPDWDISVLGLNYYGEPNDYKYPIYPCMTPQHRDVFGTSRFPSLVEKIQPDVIVIQNDPWNIPAYLNNLESDVPVVAVMPVDGKNCRGEDLNELTHAIFWTEFGQKEAEQGGYKGSSSVIPLGVDNKFFHRKSIVASREAIGIPENLQDKYIVGNINRNQPRKRLDLTVKYFCEWIKEYSIDDAYLLLHICPTGDMGYDVGQLMRYYGVKGKLIAMTPEVGQGISEEGLVDVYNSFNVQMSTTQGEGWGLTTMEGMSCGIPQIVPDWSALGEWAAESSCTVPCTSTECTPNYVNVIGGIPDQVEFVKALQSMYENSEVRNYFSNEGFNLIEQPCFRWENIAKFYDEVFQIVHLETEKVAV